MADDARAAPSSHGPSAAVHPPGTTPVRRLLLVALLLATVIGLVSTMLLRFALARAGVSLTWAEAATGWVDWYLWAAFTPLVVWLARVLPIAGPRWPLALAAHIALAALVCAAELALFALVMSGYIPLFMPRPLQPFGVRYATLIGQWLPLQMLVYALIVAVVAAFDHGRRARERDVRAARLETELARAQLHALQAQIQPHFLFNTLNTISMAVRERHNDDAVRMMALLGVILRRSMEAAVRPECTLRRELELVRDYLRIERYRMEDRLRVSWRIRPDALDARIPTMLLQPLVENAVRHGVAERAGGGYIHIAARRANGSLLLRVRDGGAGSRAHGAAGLGLSNIDRRLRARYGERARLRLHAAASGGAVAGIRLPFER